MTERSPQHVTDRRGIGQLEKDLSRYVVNVLENDYGLDFEVTLTEDPPDDDDTDQQQVTSAHFYIQLKSSAGFDNDDSVHYDLQTTHLSQYLAEPLPVVLAIYDDEYEEIYWRVIQEYVWDHLNDNTPNWREQDTVRIRIQRTRTITQYDRLEEAVMRTKNRITRRESRTMNIGEGIQFTPDDFSELRQQAESQRTSYRGHLLLEARQHLKRGRFDEAEAAINEVTEPEHEDEAKIKALFMRMIILNAGDQEEAVQIAELAAEAETTARDLDRETDARIAKVYKHVGELSVILKHREEMVVMDIVQDTDELSVQDYPAIRMFSEQKVLQDELHAAAEINTALAELLENNEYYAYATCLSPIINYAMRRTTLSVESPHTDDNLPEDVHPLVDQAEQLADFINDPETEFNLRKSAGVYRYFAMADTDTAKQRLIEARAIAEEIDDKVLIEDIENILQQIEDNPDPYNHDHDVQTTDRDPKAAAKRMLDAHGIDVDAQDTPDNADSTDMQDVFDAAVQRGVKDADPEPYHRHCEHLRLGYLPSRLGKLTGVTSIGTKTLWCQHGGGMLGNNLEHLFNSFKNEYCDGCEHHCPRPDDWNYTDEYGEEQANDPDFQAYLTAQRESLTPEETRDE